MILDLDAEASLDPGRVGSKAAWLAMGRRAGLPVLPGFVVEARASRGHMGLGAETMARRGSGGARLSIIEEPVPGPETLIAAGEKLGPALVARSSTILERGGEWSGAFTSYLDLTPADLPRAVAGCWASAFSVDALERQTAASIEPGSFEMAVLVQPALDPTAGGHAVIDDDGTITVHGTKGAPGPLLQGWAAGSTARWDGRWSGDDLVQLVGTDALDTLAGTMREARRGIGANRFEWALDEGVWLLQLGVATLPAPAPLQTSSAGAIDPILVDLVRTVVSAPGALGDELVLPWALAGLPAGQAGAETGESDLAGIVELSRELVSEVWNLPPDEALDEAAATMRELRGTRPGTALDRLRPLEPADSTRAARLLAMLGSLRSTLVELGAAASPSAAWHLSVTDVEAALAGSGHRVGPRVGIGRWEPLVTAVTLSQGVVQEGTSASGGFGAGLRAHVQRGRGVEAFSPRATVTSDRPTPDLAPLLWDAAALVTATGSPAAHLFDSARSLGVPAVCGVELTDDFEQIVAVDGHKGLVATLALQEDDDV